ncbi:hypothetical protein MPVG_00041 [Micromonas pusilla virus 12T]|uniref:hypothetical protein n=1 Tax=Micromonas pusilla virus 12T TaxID=755272 RepID=UPI0002C0DE16|nr:hypothetical protein MPVG_00041 [Micromonas pusilla virus 12T]AGH30864.1 hypothetical protein MPVG_00041 [Micromonas pusilla virus 12T]
MSAGLGAAGARAGGATADVARMSDELAKLTKFADDTKQFRQVLDTDAAKLGDISDTSKLLNRVDDETFERALKNKKVIDSLKDAEPGKLAEALNGIDDPTRLADIGKKLDDDAINALRKIDGGDDLVKKLRPNLVGRLKNTGTKLFRNRTTLKNLDESIDNISKVTKNVDNPPKDIKGVEESTKALKQTDGSVEQVSETMAKNHGGNSDDMRKSVKSVNKMLKDGSESSNSLKKALGELGITPGSAAIGAGVIVLLCMAYDTDNPFTAVDRALDDTGKVVKGFKEVADSAATAAKDVTTGGFDFISFVTNNSWISFSCSILCVILLFALFTMGMLGSMGGGNNKGR